MFFPSYLYDKRLPLSYYQMSGIRWSVKVALENLGLPGEFFKERIGSPRQSLGYNTNQKAFDKRECEASEFEMALQHKFKLQVYRELKQEIEFEESLKYAKGAP